MRGNGLIEAGTAALLGVALRAEAIALVVSNASFETPAVAPGNFNTAAPPPGWTNVVPQTVSPWTTSPPHTLKFFRAAE